jgi:hypothetical protein
MGEVVGGDGGPPSRGFGAASEGVRLQFMRDDSTLGTCGSMITFGLFEWGLWEFVRIGR